MERTQQLFEKIEEYLTGTLSKQEIVAFEEEMKADKALRDEVEKHRELQRVLSDIKTLDFKKKLQKIHKEIEEETVSIDQRKESRLTSSSLYMKIAAAIVIFLGLGAFIWNNITRQTDTISDLYLSHYTPYPIEDVTRGASQSDMHTIMEQYANGEYNTVVKELEELITDSELGELRLYLGNSYLNTGKEAAAIEQFEKVSDTSRYYEDAEWYRALSYLKIGETQKSISVLKAIISYDGIYKEQSERLINQLKK